jgi:hypothetical protein
MLFFLTLLLLIIFIQFNYLAQLLQYMLSYKDIYLLMNYEIYYKS